MYHTREETRRNGIQLWSSWICSTWIIFCAILVTLDVSWACTPCHSSCSCTRRTDQTCTVDCSSRDLSIPPASNQLPNSSTISELLLQQNRISTLASDAFDAFTNLEKLDLSNNSLTTLSDGIFNSLTTPPMYLDISNNNWTCDSDILWLHTWITTKIIHFDSLEETICSKPTKLHGRKISSLAEWELFSDLVSCYLEKDTATTTTVLFVDNDAPTNTTKKICNDFCFRENNSYGIIYNNSCACGVNAKTVLPSCSCPDLLTSTEPNTGTDFCNKTYSKGAFEVAAEIRFGTIPVISTPSSFTFTVTSSLTDRLSYTWAVEGTYLSSTLYTTSNPSFTYNFLHTGAHILRVSVAAGARKETASLPISVASPERSFLRCPKYWNIDNSINATLGSFSASTSRAVWERLHDGAKINHPSCPTGSLHQDGYCITLNTSRLSWQAAEDSCIAKGGHLVALKSSDLHSSLKAKVLDTASGSEYWTGLNDRSYNGVFMWSDGWSLGSYKNWGTDQPDEGNPPEDCVVLKKSDGGWQWHDRSCDATLPFMCQVRLGTKTRSASVRIVGAGNFGWNEMFTEVTEVAKSADSNNKTVIIFPGLWFTRTTEIRAWEFMTTVLEETTVIRLQVYSPSCDSQDERLVPPGCKHIASPYSICDSASPNCPARPNCLSYQQICLLDNTCKNLTQPCNCQEAKGYQGCSTNPKRHVGSVPTYQLWREFTIALAKGNSTLIRLPSSSFIYRNYVIGISYNSTANPIKCVTDKTSSLRQNYLSNKQSEWVNLKDNPDAFSKATWTDDQVCSLRVIGNTYTTSDFPIEIAAKDTFAGAPGVYTFKASVGNALGSTPDACNTTVMEPVDGIELLSPVRVAAGTDTSKLAPQILQLGIPQHFLIKISRGTHISASLKDAGTTPMTFSATCPDTFAPALCMKSSTDIEKPFSAVERTYNNLLTAPTSIRFTVQNQVSSKQLVLNVKLCEMISELAIINNNSVVQTNKQATFYGRISKGSCVSYLWELDGVVIQGSSSSNQLNKIFGNAGNFTLKLTASNDINTATKTLTFSVVTYADPKDAKFVSPPTEGFVGKPVTFKVSVGVNINKHFSILMDYGATTVLNTFQASQSPYETTHQHTFDTAGSYTVKANASDAGSWVVVELTLLVRYPDLTVKITTENPNVATGKPIAFVADAEVETLGYNLEYTWHVGTGIVSVKSTSKEYSQTFNTTGTYNVSVTVSTGFNDASDSLSIVVIGTITGLSLQVPHSIFEKTAAKFTASVATGTDIRYYFNTSVDALPVSTSPELKYTYPNQGTYTMIVTANNSVSHKVFSKSVTVFNITYLELTEVTGPATCSRVNFDLSFIANFVHVSPKDLEFTWEFGDGRRNVTKKGDPNVKHAYRSASNFTLKVTIKSAQKSVQGTKIVCVQERITKVTLAPNVTVVGVGSDQPGTIAVGVVVKPASNTQTFTWIFKGVSETGSPVKEKVFSLTTAGKYTLSLTVENNLNSQTQTLVLEARTIITGFKLQNDLVDNKYVETFKNVAFSVTAVSGSDIVYSWIFGDGNTLDKVKEASVTHAYKTRGGYKATVKASNLVSQGEVSLDISVQDAVSGAKLAVDMSAVDVNQQVRFTASATAGTDLSYEWKLCATCSTVTSQASTIDHKYASTGKHTASVEILNKVSQETATVDIMVLQRISELKIVMNVGTHVAKGSTVDMEAVCSRGSDLTYEWSIQHTGSRNTVEYTTKTVKFTYNEIGNYNVKVTVTNALGKDDATTSVIVQEKVTGLEIQTTKAYAERAELITFTALTSSGSDLTYEWDFGDSEKTTVAKNKIDHKYTSLGTFTVALTAKNLVSTLTKIVTVGIEEKINSIRITGCCNMVLASGAPVTMSATAAAGSNLVYTWTITGDTGKPMTFNGNTSSPTFQTNGSYKINLEVHNHISTLAVDKTVSVQTKVDKVQLVLQQDKDKLFVDQMVNLYVTTGQGSDMKYKWTLNGVEDSRTDSSLNRKFTYQGVHRIKVDVHNDVSSGAAQIELTINKLLCNVPKLSPIPTSKIKVSRSQEFDLEVEVDTMGCTVYTVKFLWTVYDSDSCSNLNSKPTVKLPTGDTTSDSALHISSGTLSVGLYCMSVNVGYSDTPVGLTDTFEVEVTASPLRAVIEGGSERSHGNTATLLLESGSYDPDVLPPQTTELKYKWTCKAVHPAPSPADACFKQPTDGAKLSIPTGSLVNGGKYEFTLTVSDGGSRMKVTTQKVMVNLKPIPDVYVSCLSCRQSGSYDVLPNRPLAIKGTCKNCNDKTITYFWTILRSDGQRPEITDASSATGNGKSSLVINPGVLSNAFSYTVKLTIEDTRANLEGSALVQLTAAPITDVGIKCQITPVVTVVLQYPVSITCTGAEASVEPNKYRVSMKWTDATNTKREIVMYYGLNPNTKVYLTHVGSKATSSVTVEVAMENKYGHVKLIKSSLIYVTELVIPSGVTRSGYLRGKVETVFTELKRKGDTVKLLQYSVALVVELNRDMGTTKKEKKDKMFIRECLLEGLYIATVTSLERIGVMGPILERLTSVQDEFESKQNKVGHILSSIYGYLEKHLTYGSETRVTNPNSLANAISNLLGIHLSNGTKEQQLKDIMKDSQNIFLSYVLAKVPEESPVEFNTEEFTYSGSKTVVGSLSRSVQFKSGAIGLQPGMIPGDKSREVAQAAMANHKNPFRWGYKSGYPVTSGVLYFTLYGSDGTEIPIKNLSKEKAVTLEFVKEGNNANVAQGKHETYLPTKNVKYTNLTLVPKDSINILVNSSKLGLTTSGAALSIQVRFTMANGESFPTAGIEAHSFLGLGTKPSLTNYTRYMTIKSSMMVKTEDYRNYTFFVNQSSFDLTKDCYILVQNNNTVSINLSVGVYISSCQFYTEQETWSSEGCEPLDTSTATVTVCSCNHLTAFGASVLVPLNAIDFTDLIRLDLATNPVAIALCSAILFVYILVLIWARRSDIRDEKKAVVVPLCGRDGPYRYEVSVYTGMMPGAGTTAQVGLKLYGEYDKSDAKHLCRPNAFRRNGHDVLVVASPMNLGDIWQIRVWHDNTGHHPTWFLSHIIIRDLQTNSHWHFPVSSWLTINAPYGVVEKKVKAASSHELADFSLRFRNEAASGFSEKHVWTSVFEHRDRSRFTRVQRVTCCVTLFYTFMCVNAMWYGLVKDTDDRWKDIWVDAFSWEELVVGILSSLMVFPINILIMQIFRKSRVKLDALKRQPKNETIEMDDLCHAPRQGSLIYDNNGNPCRLKRTEALMKIIHEGSSSDSMRTKDTSDIGTWSSGSRSSSAKHREEFARKLQLNGDDPKLWSYDSILQWPEALPSWMEHGNDSPPLRNVRRKQSTQDTANDSPEKDRRSLRRSSMARATRKMSIDTLLRSCEEDLQEEEKEVKTGKRVSVIDAKSSSTESSRKFSLPMRRSRRVSTNTTLTACGTETIPSTFAEDDAWSSLPTEMSEVSEFGSSYGLGSRRTTLISNGVSDTFDRRSTFCRNFSEGEFSIGREETFDLDSASMARSASIIASYGSRSFTSSSSGPSKLNRTTSQSLIRIPEVNHKKKQCLLPHCCVYLAYSLCAALSILSIIMVVLYGHKFGRDLALKWLLALFISFVQSAFITEPLKVVFIAIFLATVTKRADQRVEDNVEVSPILESNEKIKEDKMKPIKGFALLQALKEGRKVHRMQLIIRQSIAYFLFIWLIFVINYANNDDKAYYLTENVNNTLAKSSLPMSGRTLKSLQSTNDIWSWLEAIATPYVHSENTTDSYLYLLGVMRLRQIRGTKDNCTVDLDHIYNARFRSDGCYGKRLFDEDTATYDEMWSPAPDGKWKHETTDDWLHEGIYHSYKGGGYTMTLGSSLPASLRVISALKQANWINDRTKAVFVDFTIYNANVKLYSVVKVLFEIGGHAGMTSSIEIHTTRFFNFSFVVFNYYDIFMILLIPFFGYLLVHVALTIREERKSYAKNVWNWIELALALVMGASLAMYMYLLHHSADFLAMQRQRSGFFNFGPLAYHHAVFKRLNAVMLFILLCKITHQFRFIKIWSIYGNALGRSLVRLLWVFFLFIILWLVYGMLGYLMLGPGVYAFRSYGASILSLILSIRGSMDFFKPFDYNPWFTGFFFFTYIFLVFGFIFALIITVLQKAYHLSKSRTKYPCNLDTKDYEMIDFMLERFKVWAGIKKTQKVSRSFRKVKFKGMPSVSTRSTYSSNDASTSGQSASTTSFEALEKICKESQYTEQMVNRLAPSWEEVVAKIEKLLDYDHQEAKLCSDIARRMIESIPTYGTDRAAVKATAKPTFLATAWRSKPSIKSFIYSAGSNRTPRPPSPPAQPQGIMKKPSTLPKVTNQNVKITARPIVRPMTSRPRGSISTISSAGRSSISTISNGHRESISTTISEVSTGKQSSSSRSVISSASNASGNSNKSDSHMSVVSVRSNASSDEGRLSKSVQYTADTKPPVAPKAPTTQYVRASMPARQNTTARPWAARPTRPPHVLKSVSKNAW
ncbi:polycystin-1-like [Lineus longissimus]|uniref:polycystin-1-like n=1 Tax=Lineus longissimus TaxID=88925 RepID=UPI002B4EF05A